MDGLLYVRERQSPRIWDPFFLSLYTTRKKIQKFAQKYVVHTSKIIDIGCGSKPYGLFFQNAANYVGTDVIPGKYVDIVCDGKHIPCESASFDIIISTFSLEHNKDIYASVSEMYRMLKP